MTGPAICTLTGADDSTQPEDLFRLSADFPFVEWGVLLHEVQRGTGRYPSIGWIETLCTDMPKHASGRFALHVCGRDAVKQFLLGVGNASRIASYFGRIQLNFVWSSFDPGLVVEAIKRHPEKTVITQYNAANAGLLDVIGKHSNHAVLFDESGGRGTSPQSWPPPIPGKLCGYAGGLGPDNLDTELPRIQHAAGRSAFWIDMEAKLRDDFDRFDLVRARRCLALCQRSIDT
jgi:hypothetical protein